MSVGPPFFAAVLASKDTIITFKDTIVTFKNTNVTFKDTTVTLKYTIVFVIATWEKTGKLLRRQHSQTITIYPCFLFVFRFPTRIFSLLRIDNSGWSVNSSALFDGAGMRWYERKYHVLYTIRQTIINYLLIYFMIR